MDIALARASIRIVRLLLSKVAADHNAIVTTAQIRASIIRSAYLVIARRLRRSVLQLRQTLVLHLWTAGKCECARPKTKCKRPLQILRYEGDVLVALEIPTNASAAKSADSKGTRNLKMLVEKVGNAQMRKRRHTAATTYHPKRIKNQTIYLWDKVQHLHSVFFLSSVFVARSDTKAFIERFSGAGRLRQA